MSRQPQDGTSKLADEGPHSPALVVGLGASAGGLEPLQQFFAQLPANTGLVFVVVQHLEPHHPSLLADLLARGASVPVAEAADGVQPEADHAYVVAPGTLLVLEAGVFRVTQVAEPTKQGPIDLFFRSLAAEKGERAVGIIFSGAGHDGTAGLRTIKERGGLTLAQAPDTAKHDSMPQSAIEAGLVDHVLPPEQLAAKLLDHAGYVGTIESSGTTELEPRIASNLDRICALIRQHTGHDFARYKEGTLLRRIRRRMQVLHASTVDDYLQQLDKAPGEADALVKDLLIGVTQFFRDPEAFQVLAQQVIPRVVQGRAPDAPVRIWVAGCASGEEAYSIAILVREHLERLGAQRFVQIFATDLDTEMLAEARQGRYPLSIAEHVGPERISRFFERQGDSYQAAKELRETCIFSQHSVIRDPPFSQLDLISCRNVLIYFAGELQKKLVPLFHYALRPGGFLFLGSSEGIAGSPELFEATDKRNRIFRRKETVMRPAVEFPLAARSPLRPILPPSPILGREEPSSTLQQRAYAAFERMALDDYAPPSVVVNERAEIVFVAGRTGRFFQPPSGVPSSNVIDVVSPSLRTELRLALQAASTTQRRVVRENVAVELEDGIHRVRLTVRPLPGIEHEAGLLAIVIQEHAPLDRTEEAEPVPIRSEQPAMERLEGELRVTRAQLKTTVEDLESTNEELKSSNEELISTNEELQSANEELQTSKEELQSLNEELETVNTELRQKVEELGTANSVLQNLFASTEVASIFLDRDLRVAKFTPAATGLFHLIEADVGRPIGDFAPRFEGQDVVADAREVLRTLKPLERQVRTADGKMWFILRVLPYRTVENVIAGVVVTFVDVTELKRAEEAIREGQSLLAALSETVPDPVYVKDGESRILMANPATVRLMGKPVEQILGRNDRQLYDDPAVGEAILATDRRVMESGVAEVVEERVLAPDGYRVFLSTKAPRRDASGRVIGLVGISRDITERKEMEDALRSSEERFRLLVEGVKDYSIFMLSSDGMVASWNPGAERLKGYRAEEIIGQPLSRFFTDEDRRAGKPERELEVASTKGRCEEEGWRVRKDGSRFWANAVVTAIRDERGALRGFAKVVRDITERKRAEEALRASEDRFRTMANAIPQLAWIANPDGFIHWYNDRWYEYTGTTPQQMEGWGWQNVHDPEALPNVLERWKASLASGERFDMVFPLRGADGRFRPFLTRVEPLKDPAGRVMQWFGTNTDIFERIEAEHALRLSEERFRLVMENMSEAVMLFDSAGDLTYQNPSSLRLHGFDQPVDVAIEGERLKAAWEGWDERGRPLPPDQWPMSRVVRGENVKGQVLHARRAETGTEFDAIYNGEQVYDSSGRLVLGFITIRDITQEVRATRALEESEERLRLAQQAARIGTFEWDLRINRMIWSPELEALHGLQPGSFTGAYEQWRSLVHPDDLPQFERHLREALEGGTLEAEWRVVWPDGTVHWQSAKGRVYRDSEGKPLRMLGVNFDTTDRKLAQEALRASEERLRLALEAGELGTWDLDLVTGKAVRSLRHDQIFGYPEAQPEWTLEQALRHVVPEDRQKVLDAHSPAAGNQSMYVEARFLRVDGGIRWVMSTGRFLFDREGRPVRLTGICADITERKAAEEKLRSSELRAKEERDRLSALINSMRDEVWLVDTSRRLTLANPSVMREFLLPDGTLDAEKLAGAYEVLRDDGTPRPVEEAPPFRALRGETLDGVAEIVRTPSTGELRHRLVSAAPIKDAAGRITGSVSVVRDATELKRSAEALARSRDGLSRLADASASVMTKTDVGDMLQAISEAALALTGARLATCGHGFVSGQYIVGGSARASGAPACPPGEMFLLDKGGVHMALIEGAESIRLTDAELHTHAKWWGLPDRHVPMRGLLGVRMMARNDKPNGMILVTDKEHGEFSSEDEVLLKQLATVASLALQHVEARISLEESDRRKNQFLAMLSHELRNPLAPIRNSLYILDRSKPGGEQARRAQSVIDRQIGHMTRLVDDLLDVTRISRGKIQLHRERVDLCDLARRAIEDYRETFEQNRIGLELSVPEGAFWINADRTRIAQVIGNLLSNSAKFTPEGGNTTVTVDGNKHLGQALLVVRDTGVGISPEMLPRVFEPFAQADATLDRSRGGLGLGLAMVKGLVEMHGGTASVESAGIGKGAEFTVRIPIDLADLPTEAPLAQRRINGGPRRVLVIEDNMDAAESLRDLLQLNEHTVEVAFTGPEGIEKARGFSPEVVLCDIGLPGMDGYEVARVMRRDPTLRTVRLVALTGYAAPEDVARAQDAGFDDHLPKPPSPDRLEAILAGQDG